MRTAIPTKRIKKFLRYDATDGNFYWRQARKGSKGVGTIAGCKEKNGYVAIYCEQKRYYAHRLAWWWGYGKLPTKGVDHINGVKTDNRLINLRLATPQQNTAWRKLNKNNTSGFRGVCWFKPAKLWSARIKVNFKNIYLGYYHSKIEAALAYDAAAVQHFGKFAKTNEAMGLYCKHKRQDDE